MFLNRFKFQMHDTKDTGIIIKLIIMSINGSTGIIKSDYT